MRLAGCIKYATVVEVSSVDRAEEKIVCGSQSGASDRLSHVYTSRGNAVRLRLHVIASDDSASDAGASPRFLVHYQGVFCRSADESAEFVTPPYKERPQDFG